MKVRDIKKLKVGKMVKRISFNEIKSNVIGYDTETYNGKCTLIANSERDYILVDDYIKLLKFLTNRKITELNFFFNLEYDTNAIIKTFPNKNILDLANFNKTEIEIEDYLFKIFVVKKKALIIEKCKLNLVNDSEDKLSYTRKYKYFDIAQFYQIGSLEKTYEKVITSNTGEIFKKSLDASKQFPLEKINNEDIEYCINDAIATKHISEYFVSTTRKLIPVKNFYSPASLGKYMLRVNLKESYKFNPSGNIGKLQSMALSSYNGGRFETSKIGKFNGYQYDINSAYPSALYKLSDLSGHIIFNKEYMESSTHSFFKVSFKIDKNSFYLSPIKYEFKNMLIYPDGNFNNVYLTKTEFELLDELGINIKIHEAGHILNDEPDKPFDFIKPIYDLRVKYKKSSNKNENALVLPLKLSLNSIYGLCIMTTKKYNFKTDSFNEINIEDDLDNENLIILKCPNCNLEYNEITLAENNNICICGSNSFKRILVIPEYVAGDFYNPIIASEITADVRCKLFRDSIKDMENIFMYATDSITTSEKMELPISDKLGEYSKTEKLNGTIYGTGIYSLHNDKEHKVRFRGFSKTDMNEVAKNNLDKDSYHEIKNRPVKLKEAIIQKKRGIENLNVFDDFEKNFKLNFDIKRVWDRPLKNFEDVLNNTVDSKTKNVQEHLV